MDLIERRDTSTPRHPWELARRSAIMRILRNESVVGQPTRVLDIGAGDAWLGKQLFGALPEGSTVTCWDINYGPEELVHLTTPGQSFEVTATRPAGRYDGVLMLDVMEHVEDHRALVSDALDLMVDGGWLLVTVPAYQGLFSSHDQALLHYRRYSPSRCRNLLKSAGLQVVSEGGLFFSLLGPRVAQVLRERTLKRSPHDQTMLNRWDHGARLTQAAAWFLDIDCRISLGLRKHLRFTLPGLSYWAFCERVRPRRGIPCTHEGAVGLAASAARPGML